MARRNSTSSSKLSPAKKISLLKQDSQQIRDMNDQIKALTEENQSLKDSFRHPQFQYSGIQQAEQDQSQLMRRLR
jgi:cell shape-determining protein MreC